MSDEIWLTVSEVAERFGIPQPTIRRYIERHGHRLHIRKHHKSYLIAEKSLEDLVRMREGYSQGMSADQVEESLTAAHAPTIITVSDQSGERVSVNLDEALSGLGKSVIEGFKRQEEFNRKLLESLQREREEHKRQREEDREKIDRLTDLVLQQKETAAAALPSPKEEQRSERLNDRLTERRIVKQLRDEALPLWLNEPEGKRMKKTGLFRKEEDLEARDRFIRDYVDNHFEQRIKGEYGL